MSKGSHMRVGETEEHPAMLLLGSSPEVAAHGRAVARIAVLIGAELGLSRRANQVLGVAAGLHDLGKLPMPSETLSKPGRLSPKEWAQVQLHPVVGEQLLVSAGLSEIAPWVRSHHERPDGTGYPDGLTGPSIPLESRIIAVADAYDAMVSDRPYSPAVSESAARQELRDSSGTQFDPLVVDAFLDAHPVRPPVRRFRAAGQLHAVA